jgi:hypothetical protein
MVRTVVRIDGYLAQAKLAEALASIVGEAAWRGREVRVKAGSLQRWDMLYEIASEKVAVEFDGDEHYRHSLKIKADREKDELAKLGGYRVVRVPYWVQLTSETLRHYFGLDAEIAQDFPHGFITTKIFPASFCELGLARFTRELDSLPSPVRNAVITSLRDRAAEFGKEYVVPDPITHLLGGPCHTRYS